MKNRTIQIRLIVKKLSKIVELKIYTEYFTTVQNKAKLVGIILFEVLNY